MIHLKGLDKKYHYFELFYCPLSVIFVALNLFLSNFSQSQFYNNSNFALISLLFILLINSGFS